MRHTVSIIVPVYKVEPYLERCVKSILAQSYTDWELILVDDGSPDHCPEMCDTYATEDKRIKVIHKANGGLSDARNHGLDAATSEFVLFVDSDDYIHYRMIETMMKHAIGNDADIVQCSYIRGTDECFPTIKESTNHETFDSRSIFASIKQQTILCAKLYRRTLWEGLRMPIGKIHEDDFTTWKLYYRSKRIVVIDTPYYYYYKNPQGIMSNEGRRFNPVLVEAYEERIAFFEEQDEEVLALLSRWRFCMPLMYIYLRGNITINEGQYILSLLHKNIKLFTCCSQIPRSHRITFTLLMLLAKPLRHLLSIAKSTTSKFLRKKISNHI